MGWTLETIKDIIAIFEGSDLSKIEIEDGDKKIVLNRESTQGTVGYNSAFRRNIGGYGLPQSFQSIAKMKEMQDELADAKESMTKNETKEPIKKASTVIGDKDGTYVKASMAGILYMQPKPGDPPYVEVGKSVKKGDTVALIEAMKMINEITAPCDGVIKEIFFQNEQFVEFDSPIFLIVEE